MQIMRSFSLFLMILATATISFAQEHKKADADLAEAMENFRSAITNKDTAAFLGLVSRTKGISIMNTIDQGEEGNAERPMLDVNLRHALLVADFKKKGEHYANFFNVSEMAPSFYDQFIEHKGDWRFDGKGKFMPIGDDGKPVKEMFVKWEKIDGKWFAVEVGIMIS